MINRFKFGAIDAALNHLGGTISDVEIYASRFAAIPEINATDQRLNESQQKFAAMQSAIADTKRLYAEMVAALSDSHAFE